MVDHAPAVSTTTTATTTTAGGSGGTGTAAAPSPAVVAALAAVPAAWKTAFPTLFTEQPSPTGAPPPAQFGDRAYRMMADAEQAVDVQPMRTVLAASDAVREHAQALDTAKANHDADVPLAGRIRDDVVDLCGGGDVQFNSRRIMGNHGALSLRGKAWFKESPRATTFCIQQLQDYIDGDAIGRHAFTTVAWIADAMAELQRSMTDRRRNPCQALLNLLRTGSLVAPTGDAAAPTGAAAPADDRDANRAGQHGTPEEEETWTRQADELKERVRAIAPRRDEADRIARSSDSQSGRALTDQRFRELLDQIYAAPPPVRERVFADAAVMRLITESGTTAQMTSLMRALDPVEDLYDQCCRTGPGGSTADPGLDERGQAVPRPTGTPYQIISSWLLAHPGTGNRDTRMRVLRHTRLKDDYIDAQGADERRTLYRIIARGTAEPNAEDQIQQACASGDGAAAVRGLMRMAGEDPQRLRELQDDQVFYAAIVRMTTPVAVDGVEVIPYHLALQMWGRPVGNTTDPMVGEMQAAGAGGEELRPLRPDERADLERRVFDPAIDAILPEATGMWMTDSTVMSALRTFQRRAAEEAELIRRLGQAPGPALSSLYNQRHARSLGNDLRAGLDEENAREAERIIGAAIDSATVGTLGNAVTLASDALRAEGGHVPLEQALRETLHGGEPVTQIIHDAAQALYGELTDFWNIITVDDMRTCVSPARTAVEATRDQLVAATGLEGRIFWEELLENAFTEIGGSLETLVNQKLSGDELTEACTLLRIGRQYDAEREAARARATGEPLPDRSAERARTTFGPKAQELFQAYGGLGMHSVETAFTHARELRQQGHDLQLDGGVMATIRSLMPTVPGAGDAAATAPAEGAPTTFEAFYRQEYGIDPTQHAVMVARSCLAPRPGGGTSTRLSAASLATWLGVDEAALSGAIPAPTDTPDGISADDRRQVRPDFTWELAQHNAREIWEILHGAGQIQLISTVLYGVYNDTEQRYIRAAFRALSGGPDIHFYIRQAQELQRRGRSGGFAFTSVGAEGTEDGQEVATGGIRITGDATDLETALAVTTTGVVDARTRVSTAVGNGDMNQLFRVIDDLDDAGRRQVLGDAALMARIRAACNEVNYDRVYRGLMGTSTLRTRLESRAHGAQDWWAIFDATDEDGMREDIQAYIRQLRRHYEDEVRRELRGREGPMPPPEQIGQLVEQRVREACRDMLANPDIEGILRDELSGYDLSRTEGLFFNAGEENAAAHVLRDGDWSEDEAEILTAIRGMSPEERARRLQDPEFMMRLGDLIDDEDQYRDAMSALTAGESAAAGSDHLQALDEASRSHTEVSGDISRDEDAILDNLAQLSPAEYRRLMDDPRLMAQVLHGLDDNPEMLARARRLMAFRFEELGDTVAGMRVAAEGEEATGDVLPRAEAQRLAYLKFQAIERMRYAMTRTWNVTLEHATEVFKMDLSPNLPARAPAPTPDAARPAGDGGGDGGGGDADAPRPRGPRDPHEITLRREIWTELSGAVESFCDQESSTTEVASESMQRIVEQAIKGERDPSSARISDRLGAFDDDDDAITATLRAASDDVLIQEWTSVEQRTQTLGPSFKQVYERYKQVREAEAAAAASAGGGDAVVVADQGDGTAAVTDTATGTTETRPTSPAATDAPTTAEPGAEPVAAGPTPAVDAVADAGPPQPTESPELEQARLGFMNYVIDISSVFERLLAGHAGGIFTEGNVSTPATGRLARPPTSVEDNSQWHEWCDILRERIPNLDKDKVADAIGATDPADRDLVENPNRTARTQLAFRTHRYLRQRGTQTGSGLGVAHDEAESLDQAMTRYGREVADAETNDEGGYGEITDAEGNRIEAVHGHEFDRALEAYRGAKQAIADWAAIIVGLVITAVITILTAGTATGPMAMILIGAMTSAAAATGQALTREAILGTDYEFSREGLQSIAAATVTGVISAGATYYAQGLLAGLTGLGTLGAQTAAASQVLARQPGVWTQLGLQVAEEGLSSTFEGGANALLAAIDPSNFVDGFDEGLRRAQRRVEGEVAAIPGSVLQASLTSILSFGMGQARTAMRGSGADADDVMDQLADEVGTIDVRRNFRAYFGDQSDTISEAFAGWLVEQGMAGRFPDLEDVPADLVRAYLQELTEKGQELHAATSHAGERGRRADDDLDANGHLLTAAERASFREMAVGASETSPYVSVADFVAVRQQRMAASLEVHATRIGRPLTADEVAAFVEHCRSAASAEEFVARANDPAGFFEARGGGDTTADTTEESATEESATEESATEESATTEDPASTDDAATVAAEDTAALEEAASESPVSEDAPTSEDEAREEAAEEAAAESTETTPLDEPAVSESPLETLLADDEASESTEVETEIEDQVATTEPSVVVRPTIVVDDARLETVRGDVLGYVAGYLATLPLDARRAFLTWLRSPDGTELCRTLLDDSLTGPQRAAAARERAAEVIADWQEAGAVAPDATGSPDSELLTDRASPVATPDGPLSSAERPALFDEQGRSPEEVLVSFASLPWDAPVNLMPGRLKLEYAIYLCTPPHGGKQDATAWRAARTEADRLQITLLAPTLSAEHVDALRTAFPRLTGDVPEGGPISAEALQRVFDQFTRAGDFASSGNDLAGFERYIDRLASEGIGGLTGDAGMIVTDRDVSDPTVAPNRAFGRYADSQQYISDPLVVATMTPEQYSAEIGIINNSGLWPIASEKLRELVSLFGPEEGRREWVAWVNAHGGFKPMTHLNIVWNGPALAQLLHYRGEHAMAGLTEQVTDQIPLSSPIFTTQLIGIPVVPGEPIGVTLERHLRAVLVQHFGRTEAEVATADLATLLSWAQIAHDQATAAARTTPEGGAGGGGDADATPTPDPRTEGLVVGHSEAVPGSTYRGDVREEAAPEQIQAQIGPAAAQVAAMFGDHVVYDGGNQISVRVGDRVVTVTVDVVPSQMTDGHPANLLFDRGSDVAVLEISDRVRDKHVERALAHEIGEILSDMQAAAGLVDRADDGSALGAAGDGAALSHDDLGRIAELRVLLRQLEAERAPDGRNPNPVVVGQLENDLRALLDHLGLRGEGAEADARRRAVEGELGRSVADVNASLDAASEAGAAEADPVSPLPAMGFAGGALAPDRARTVAAVEAAVGDTTALPAGTTATSTEDGVVVTVPVAGGDPVTVTIRTTTPGEGVAAPVASHALHRDGGATITVSEGASPEHIQRAVAQQLAEIAFRAGEAARGVRTDTTSALAEGSQATALSARDAGNVAQLRVLGEQLRAARASGDDALAARLGDELTSLLMQMGLLEHTDPEAQPQVYPDHPDWNRVAGREAVDARMGLIEAHLAAQGVDIAEIRALIEEAGSDADGVARARERQAVARAELRARIEEAAAARRARDAECTAAVGAAIASGEPVVLDRIIVGGGWSAVAHFSGLGAPGYEGGGVPPVMAIAMGDDPWAGRGEMLMGQNAAELEVPGLTVQPGDLADDPHGFVTSSAFSGAVEATRADTGMPTMQAAVQRVELRPDDADATTWPEGTVRITLDDGRQLFARAVSVVSGPGPARSPREGGGRDTPRLISQDGGLARDRVADPESGFRVDSEGNFYDPDDRPVDAAAVPADVQARLGVTDGVFRDPRLRRDDETGYQVNVATREVLDPSGAVVDPSTIADPALRARLEGMMGPKRVTFGGELTSADFEAARGDDPSYDVLVYGAGASGSWDVEQAHGAEGMSIQWAAREGIPTINPDMDQALRPGQVRPGTREAAMVEEYQRIAAVPEADRTPEQVARLEELRRELTFAGGYNRRNTVPGLGAHDPSVRASLDEMMIDEVVDMMPTPDGRVLVVFRSGERRVYDHVVSSIGQESGDAHGVRGMLGADVADSMESVRGAGDEVLGAQTANGQITVLGAASTQVGDAAHRADLAHQGEALEGDSQHVTVGIRPLAGRLHEASDRMRRDGEEDTTSEATDVDAEDHAAAVAGGTAAPLGGFHGTARTDAQDLTDDVVDRMITQQLALIAPEGAQRVGTTNTFLLRAPDGTEVPVRVVVRSPEEEQGAAARWEPDPEHDGGFVVIVSARAADHHVVRGLAHELAEIQHVLEHGPESAREQSERPDQVTAHLAGRIAELRVLLSELDRATTRGGDRSQADRIDAELRELLAAIGMDASAEGRARLEQLVGGTDAELARRAAMFHDGLLHRPELGASTDLEAFAEERDARVASLGATATGDHVDSLLLAEAMALDGELRLEESRRILHDANAAAKRVSPEARTEVLQVLQQIRGAINDPNLDGDVRRDRMLALIDRLEGKLAPEVLEGMRRAAEQFGATAGGRPALTLDLETGRLFGVPEGLPGLGGAEHPSMRDLIQLVDQANRAAAENGLGIQYVLVVHDPVEGAASVEVLSRPAPQTRLPSQGSGIAPVGAQPGDLQVDVGVGDGNMLAEQLGSEDGTVVQTDVLGMAEAAQEKRHVDGIMNAAPLQIDGAVVMFADILQHPELLRAAAGEEGGVRRIVICNCSAHYTTAQYMSAARALVEVMAEGAIIDVQWDDSPESEGAELGSRHHIHGQLLAEAIQAAGREVTTERAEPSDYGFTIDSSAMANPDLARVRHFQAPSSGEHAHRLIIRFGPRHRRSDED